jgi:hypothetical protein
MNRLTAFLRFLYDFVVGDDWRVAGGVAIGLGLTALLAHLGLSAWWLPPVAISLVLGLSLTRVGRS